MAKKLTPKQAAFCEEYLVDLNGTQAAIRAGYSPNRASEIGYQQLQKTAVQDCIAKMKEQRSQRTRIDADSVLREIKAIAETCAEVIDGEIRNAPAALKAYELLGKHLALFVDRKITHTEVVVTGFAVIGK